MREGANDHPALEAFNDYLVEPEVMEAMELEGSNTEYFKQSIRSAFCAGWNRAVDEAGSYLRRKLGR